MISFVICLIFSVFGDDPATYSFTFVHTNDIHGWVNGDSKTAYRTAKFPDYLNFLNRMKAQETNTHKVFVFDSGDLTQGTGLSDTTDPPGKYIFELAHQLPFDALTIGNHELYAANTIDYIIRKGSKEFGDKYICCNVRPKDESLKIAENYKLLHVDGFGSILVIGMIFDFSFSDESVIVTKFTNLHTEDGEAPTWLSDALKTTDLRFVVVLAHVPPQQTTVPSEAHDIVEALKKDMNSAIGKELPIIFLGGHDHTLVNENDKVNYFIESDAFFNYISVIDFEFPADPESEPEIMNYKINQLQTNTTILQNYVGVSADKWETEESKQMQKDINDKVKELKLDEAIGYARHAYNRDANDHTDNSLYHLYIEEMCPTLKPHTRDVVGDNKQKVYTFYTINSKALRSTWAEGNITYDDVISVDPFQNTWCTIRNVSVDHLKKLIAGKVNKTVTAERYNQIQAFRAKEAARAARLARANGVEDPAETAAWEAELKRQRLLDEEDEEEVRYYLRAQASRGHRDFSHLVDGVRLQNEIVNFEGRYYYVKREFNPEEVHDIVTNIYDCKILKDALLSDTDGEGVYEIEQTDDMTIDYLLKYVREHMKPDPPDHGDDTPETRKPVSYTTTYIIIGASVGSVLIAGVIVFVVIWCFQRRKRMNDSKTELVDKLLDYSSP